MKIVANISSSVKFFCLTTMMKQIEPAKFRKEETAMTPIKITIYSDYI